MALKRVPLDLGVWDARCAREPLTLTSSTTGLVTLGRAATVFRTPGPAGSRPVASVCGDQPSFRPAPCRVISPSGPPAVLNKDKKAQGVASTTGTRLLVR